MILLKIVEFVLGFFSFPLEWVSSLATAGAWVGYVNYYIPVDHFVGNLTIYISVWVVCAIISVLIGLL